MRSTFLILLMPLALLFACNEADVEVEKVNGKISIHPFTAKNDKVTLGNATKATVKRPSGLKDFIDYMDIKITNPDYADVTETFNFDNSVSETKMEMDVHFGKNTITCKTDKEFDKNDTPKDGQLIGLDDTYMLEYQTDPDQQTGWACGRFVLNDIVSDVDKPKSSGYIVANKLRTADPYAPYEGSKDFIYNLDQNQKVKVEMATTYGRVIATVECHPDIRDKGYQVQARMYVQPVGSHHYVVDCKVEEGSWFYLSNENAKPGTKYWFTMDVINDEGGKITLQSKEKYDIVSMIDQWRNFIVTADDLKEKHWNWEFETPWEKKDTNNNWKD